MLQLLPQLQCWTRTGAFPVTDGLERHTPGLDATAFATAAVLDADRSVLQVIEGRGRARYGA